jgi:hypothetical protein
LSKSNKDFKVPPVSTLIGSTLPNFFRVLKMGNPEIRFYPKLLLTLLVIIISSPFQLFEYFYFRNKVRKFKFKEPPVFIIGHWRSGTTHLHNLLCQDPNHGYLTTYQSVFPNNMVSKWIFKTFMSINIPETRPADNVKLSPDYPQEEEFALANMTTTSFYHFFYFPSINDLLYQKFIRFDSLSTGKIISFQKKYKELLTKAALNSKKDRLIIKNPVNTGKIKMLLKMYPDAKFIHIHRNPVITYLSTYKFFTSLLPTTALEKYEKDEIKELIIRNYKNLMRDYLDSRQLIPAENLVEMPFDEFEENNLAKLKYLYEKLGLETWAQAENQFLSYISSQKHYKKNKHTISKDDLNAILKEWGFAMKEFGYSLPEHVEVVT